VVVPRYYVDQVKDDLGPLWKWLPRGAMIHDPNAYLKSVGEEQMEVAEERLVV
jgi:hypothetical protein